MSPTFVFRFSSFLTHHDTVSTLFHYFMHRFPRLLMMPVSCLFYHPFLVACCILLFPSLRFSLSISVLIRSPPLDTPSLPLHPLLIHRFFVRHVQYTYTSALIPTRPIPFAFRVFVRRFPLTLIFLFLPRDSCAAFLWL